MPFFPVYHVFVVFLVLFCFTYFKRKRFGQVKKVNRLLFFHSREKSLCWPHPVISENVMNVTSAELEGEAWQRRGKDLLAKKGQCQIIFLCPSNSEAEGIL